MVLENMKNVIESDPLVGRAIFSEYKRQVDNIELIASENFVSDAVMSAMATVLTNKYAEGYPSKRYYGGCECVDVVENIARDRACQIFGAEHANVQPHSGAQANMAAYQAVLQTGDTVLGMSLANGGHLTHGSPVNASGILYNFIPYELDENQRIDYDAILELAKIHKPKLIVAGASAYSREIDFEKFAQIAQEVDALLMVDMAHIAGLVAAGLHKNPIPYADIVTTTTHKTLRGPRGGLILCKKELAAKIDKAIFPGSQGGPLMHIIAAKAVCFGEALKPEFKLYQEQIIKNSKALEEAFEEFGMDMVSHGSDNHLILLDLTKLGITGKEMQNRLDEVRITTNKNSIPNDPQSPFVTSGLRVGTPAVTTRGYKERDMYIIAKCIYLTATDFTNQADYIRSQVAKLCDKYPLYQ